ncbi:MAG: DUF5668 domain-containing protein [Acidobacteria bacterium]|nr:DUF5668 domain-containing protein [Acidobacteriota bacterium]
MSNGIRCRCGRCTVSGMMGPVVLITLGVLFLIGKMNMRYDFGDLWPILLVVIGLVKVFSAMASTEGHAGPGQPTQPGQPGQ